MANELSQEKLESMLTSFRDDVTKAIDTRVKQESDVATKEVGELQKKLGEANAAIKELQESSKKSFGLAGLDGGVAKKFSWANYYRGLALNHDASKGRIESSVAKNYWDKEASFEATLCREYGATVKDFNATDGSSGGFVVPPQVYQGDIIDTVYANTAVLQMPVLKLPNLRSDVPIPVDNGNLTAYSLGETEKPTKTSSSFKLEWLRPKKIGCFVKISKRLLYQTNDTIATLIKSKITNDMSVKLSAMLTNGKGADSEGKGIMQYVDDMTDYKVLSANGARFTIDHLASMKQSLAVVNELRDTPTYGAIMRPEVEWGMLRQKVEMYSGQSTKNGMNILPASLILDKANIEGPLKMKIASTTQISATDTCGTTTTASKVVLGDWSKFVYASFRDPEFRMSDVAGDGSTGSALLDDELYMVMFLEYDCVCLRAAAFTARKGAQTAEASW